MCVCPTLSLCPYPAILIRTRANAFGVGMGLFRFAMSVTVGAAGLAHCRTASYLFCQPVNVQYIIEGGLDEHFSPDDGRPMPRAPA